MALKIIQNVRNLKGKNVLLRVDYNIPIKNNRPVDDYKIIQSLPTISFLRQQGAKVIVVTHLGRPKKFTKQLSTAPLARHLEKLFGQKVAHIAHIKDWRRLERKKLLDVPLVMLDNIRFYKEEENNSAAFAKQLSSLGDIFVLDGFAVSHRVAASVTGIAEHLPSYAGMLLSQEVTYLGGLLKKPARPFVVVLGGAKVETKIPLLETLLPKADYVLLGGDLANTYCASLGYSLGNSLFDRKYIGKIKKLAAHKKVVVPVDYVVGDQNGKNTYCIVTEAIKLPRNTGIYDIGPRTIQLYASYIKKAKTIMWNGAMGKFEEPVYGYGTKALACLIAAKSKGLATGIVGGGETVQAVRDLAVAKDIDWVSTGGGAMLDYLSGRRLPGLQRLY